MSAISDLPILLREMEPWLHPGTYVFASVPEGHALDLGLVVACVREPEGLSVVLEEPEAKRQGLPLTFRCAWITLAVSSALEAVGLTAAFSRALAQEGIGCNVIAGAHHDHLFVPIAAADRALAALRALQARAARAEVSREA